MTRLLTMPRFKRLSAHSSIMLFVIAACLLVLGVNAWPTWQARSLALEEDRVETTNLARSLAQHAHGTVQTADAAVLGLRARIEDHGVKVINLQHLHMMMADYVDRLPMLNGLFVYGADGSWIVTSATTQPESGLNNADRAYFQYHRTHTDRGTHVDLPVRSKSDGRWILPVSRRIDNPDGSFGGVVLATVSIDFFQHFYQTFDPGAAGAISLASVDGRIVARNPIDEKVIGVDYSKGPIFARLSPSVHEQTFAYTSPVDTIKRYGSVSRVDEYPLVVIVSHSEAEALADWWSNAMRYLMIGCAASASLIFLGMRMVQQIRSREETERQYRLLADFSSDAIICATMSGQPIFVSPSFSTLTGWSARERLRLRWDTLVHAEDKAAVAEALETLRQGADAATICYRYMRKDGTAIWVEARLRVVPGQDGADRRLVANIRDITQRKADEDRIAALNAELAAQALTDGLTGLPNRRCFDNKLAMEWARAARTGTPLSLVMIDVDRFKLYNDRYGHQQGDECLRRVAGAIAGHARRPGDVAARYGGEEVVVILPNTSAAGAAGIAERMRRAVQACEIEHRDNKPWGVVTASFGIATLSPEPSEAAAAPTVLGLADAALYHAKHTGRNRVFASAEGDPGDSRQLRATTA